MMLIRQVELTHKLSLLTLNPSGPAIGGCGEWGVRTACIRLWSGHYTFRRQRIGRGITCGRVQDHFLWEHIETVNLVVVQTLSHEYGVEFLRTPHEFAKGPAILGAS